MRQHCFHVAARVRGDHLGIVLNLCGGPWAIVTPWSSTVICSQISITRPMSCSISRIATPNSIANLADRLGQLAFLLRIQAGGRLIEQQHLRLGRQCANDFQMALVAVAQAVGRLVRAVLQVEQAQAARTPCDEISASSLR